MWSNEFAIYCSFISEIVSVKIIYFEVEFLDPSGSVFRYIFFSPE